MFTINSRKTLKFMLPLMALLLVSIALFSFSTKQQLSTITFRYQPPTTGDYSLPSVLDKDNWVPGMGDCNDQDLRACTIEVPVAYTINDGTELASTVIISADTNNLTDYFVDGGTNIVDYVNKN